MVRILISLGLLLNCALGYASPTEGKQYLTLEKPYLTNAQFEKYFSLTCNPCWRMSELLHTKGLAEGEGFQRTHIIFNDSTRQSAKLYYTVLVQKGSVSHELLNELFRFVQTSRSLKTQEIDKFLKAHQLLDSNSLTNRQQKKLIWLMQDAEQKTRQAEISAIPSLIVNGQYKVLLKGHQSLEQLCDTLGYLGRICRTEKMLVNHD